MRIHGLRSVSLDALGAFALAICLLATAPAVARPRPELETEVHPTRVEAGQSLSLRISLRGALMQAEPDLTPLEHDFRIVDVTRSQRQIVVNGDRDESVEWQIDLRPLQTGPVTIPALEVGGSRTQAAAVTVAQASAPARAPAGGNDPSRGQPIFVESEFDRPHPYEQERVVLRVRVYVDAAITQGGLAEPRISEGATLERIGEDRSFDEERGGRHYQGVERVYAVTPMKAGPLEVAPIRFEAILEAPPMPRGRQRRGSSLFDDFFSDFGFGDDLFERVLGAQGRRVAVESTALVLDVRPRPAESAGHWWIPARNLSIEESWSADPATAKVGEAITRRISLRAEGASANALPPLPLPEVAGLKQYAEAPVNRDGPTGGVRVQDTTLIPTEAGSLVLPAIDIHWWDVESDTPRVAQIPARTLGVRGAPAATANTTSEPSAALPTAGGPDTPGPDRASQRPDSPEVAFASRTIVLGAVGVAIVIAAAFALGRRFARASLARRRERSRARRDLRKACGASDTAAATRAVRRLRAIEGTDSDRWRAPELAAALAVLDEVRYSTSEKSWNGAALWKAYRLADRRSRFAGGRFRRHEPRGAASLPPLYPTRHQARPL